MIQVPALPTPTAPATPRVSIRLTPCPACGSRWRSLSEAEGELLARCLGCGTRLHAALTTETLGEMTERRREPAAATASGSSIPAMPA